MNYSEQTRTLGRVGPPPQQGGPGRFGGPAGPGLGSRGFSDPGVPPFANMGPGPALGGPLIGPGGGPAMGPGLPMGGPRPFVSSTCKFNHCVTLLAILSCLIHLSGILIVSYLSVLFLKQPFRFLKISLMLRSYQG